MNARDKARTLLALADALRADGYGAPERFDRHVVEGLLAELDAAKGQTDRLRTALRQTVLDLRAFYYELPGIDYNYEDEANVLDGIIAQAREALADTPPDAAETAQGGTL